MTGAKATEGRIAVIDHAPSPALIDDVAACGFSCTIVSEPGVDASHLQALSAIDAVLVAGDHPQRDGIVAVLRAARIDAPVVWIARGSGQAAADELHDPPARGELRMLSWLVLAEQRRRAVAAAATEAHDHRHLSELGKVVTQVVHEIRNPLTALSAKLQWLKRKAEDSPLVVQASETLLDEVHRLSRMLHDLLEYGRSRTYSRRTSSEVRQTLDEVVALYREACEQARVHLVLEKIDGGARVPFPSEELHQVFQNLLTNAIDATPPDESIHIRVESQANGTLRVEFKNPGHLPDHVQEKAFELFFTTKPNGTGLGLPIVRRIVAGVSGEIEALNVGGHVVIRLTLPVVA